MDLFITSDPPERNLGSGGGSAHLLAEAFKASPSEQSFDAWLDTSRKLLIHGSGESRRLPGYAVLGKPLIPVPPLPHRIGNHPDQRLLDLQIECYDRLFWHAPDVYPIMITCGDVLLGYRGPLPVIPGTDVCIFGLQSTPEEAMHHGVMFCKKDQPASLEFFLQKPDPDEVRRLAPTHDYFLDTGAWVLSRRALYSMMRKSGWNESADTFGDTGPLVADLYGGIGPALGRDPHQQDPELSGLRCTVIPLPEGRFYHFGSNRSLLASTRELVEPSNDKRALGHNTLPGRTLVVRDSRVGPHAASAASNVWIDNSTISESLTITKHHVLTNLPESQWPTELGEGACFDAVPLGNNQLCLRPYGFDDAFRGAVAEVKTTWLNRPALSWFAAREILPEDAGFPADIDLQEAPIFPVVDPRTIDPGFVRWLTDDSPEPNKSCRGLWLESRRYSARQLLLLGDMGRLIDRGKEKDSATSHSPEKWGEICARTDLRALSGTSSLDPPPPLERGGGEEMSLSVPRDRMYRAVRAGLGGDDAPRNWEVEAFDALRDMIVGQLGVEPATPTRNVLDDQIVWGRCPARLDLAGGWTDTPPYCLEFGGHIVNVAVNLNGQPPIQVFVRCIDEPVIRIRSIDLGMEELVDNYGALENPEKLGSGFGIAKCALALAGFTPAFHPDGGGNSLRDQLSSHLGGGLEVTQLAAIPKGSGLGTSSVLAATLLGTLNDVLGLEWSRSHIFRRTLALEQMLGAGGGWQDQAGGMLPGLKRIDTVPGLSQEPEIQWLPHDFLGPGSANSRVLLYYTGLTRTAHDLLAEIVRGMFLNDRKRLAVLEEIGWNASFASKAIQKNDWDGICESVRRSWLLNQGIDAGTNPPAVQAIIEAAGDGLAAGKLLGAGGGGYMLMLAHDEAAGAAIKNRLRTNPPNQQARFVDLSVSESGFQVTRSSCLARPPKRADPGGKDKLKEV